MLSTLVPEIAPFTNQGFGQIVDRLHRLAGTLIGVAVNRVLGMDRDQHLACRPMGISRMDLGQVVPEKLKSSLPTVEELELELTKD